MVGVARAEVAQVEVTRVEAWQHGWRRRGRPHGAVLAAPRE